MSWTDVIADVNRGFIGEAVPGAPQPTPTFSDADAAVQALPARSRDKLLELRQRAADARAAIEAAMDARDDAWTQAADLERALKNLTNPFARGGHQRPVSDAEVQRVQAKLDGTKDRRARANAHLDTLGRAHAPLSTVLEKSDRFIIGRVHTEFTGSLPAPAPRETAAAAVTRMRGTIDNLKRDRDKAARAPVPMQLAIDRAKEQISKFAASGMPDVGPLFGRDIRFIDLAWPVANVRLDLFGDARPAAEGDVLRRLMGFAGGDQPNAVALIAWLFHEQIEARVIDEIKKHANEKDALSATQLAARRAELAAELLLAERCEVAAIERAEADGATIPLRPDCDIRALLWLA